MISSCSSSNSSGQTARDLSLPDQLTIQPEDYFKGSNNISNNNINVGTELINSRTKAFEELVELNVFLKERIATIKEEKQIEEDDVKEDDPNKTRVQRAMTRFTAFEKRFLTEESGESIQGDFEGWNQEILDNWKKKFSLLLSQKCNSEIEKQEMEKKMFAFFDQRAAEMRNELGASSNMDNVFSLFKKMLECELSHMNKHEEFTKIMFACPAKKQQADKATIPIAKKLKAKETALGALKCAVDIVEARFKERIQAIKDDLSVPAKIVEEEPVEERSIKLSKEEKKEQAQELDQLVEWINSDSKGKKRAKKKSRQKSQQVKKVPQRPAKASQPKNTPLQRSQSERPDAVAATFAQKSAQLCERLFLGHPLRVHERVYKRWMTRDIGTLRKALPGYSEKNDTQLLLERAKHYLPGVDRLAVSSLARQVYGFVTERDGIGFFCRLDYNGEKYYGPVECGIDGDLLFHCYLSVKTAEQIAQMGAQNLLEAQSGGPSEDPSAAPWESNAHYTKEVSEDGNVTMTYYSKAKKGVETHRLTIYPIRDEQLLGL